MARKTRTLTLPDDVFDGLKLVAAYKKTSISKIVEELARQYLADNRAEIQEELRRQMNLFDSKSDD